MTKSGSSGDNRRPTSGKAVGRRAGGANARTGVGSGAGSGSGAESGASKTSKTGKAAKARTVIAGGHRQLVTKVKTAKRRTTSSARWLERQLNDPYVAEARAAGWRSRAAFKLLQINEAHRLLKPGMCVVDLGAAPGGWSQVAAKAVRAEPMAGNPDAASDAASVSNSAGGHVVAIDLLEMEAVPGVVFFQGDFTAAGAPERLIAAIGGRQVDVVLSDMAAATTGHKQTDHLRIIALAEEALVFAMDILVPGGAFLAKVFQGGTEADLLNLMKRNFAKVKHVKPEASRADSAELYVLATGFKGRPQD